MNNIAIIGGHGLGDCLLSLQCEQWLCQNKINSDCFLSCRDEIAKPLDRLFSFTHLDESISENNNFIKHYNILSEFQMNHGPYDEIYYVIPSLLFRNKFAFDYKKYNVHPQTLRQIRLLTDVWRPQKTVYVGLNTSTPNYDYPDIRELLVDLADRLPDYNIYCPVMSNWNGEEIKLNWDITGLPSNVTVDMTTSLEDSLDQLKQASYGIFTDNGPSHLAYHLGMPRLILDPQLQKPAWDARWKEDPRESIYQTTPPSLVADIVKLNLELPPTTLIDRKYLIGNCQQNWNQILFLDNE